MMNRRESVILFAALGALASACRAKPADREAIIRAWFAERQWPTPSSADIEAVRRYIERPGLTPDPNTQPATLFNAEVDLG